VGDTHEHERHHLRRCENPARRRLAFAWQIPPAAGCRDPGERTLAQPGTESGTRERLGDYYLYPPGRTDNDCQPADQAGEFPGRARRSATHGYEYDNPWLGTADTPQSANRVRFSTSAHAASAINCPRASCGLLTRQRGEPQFIGESRIDHHAHGTTLSLATGDAFDVKIQSTVVKRSLLAKNDWQTDMRYTLTNALPQPVTVALLQSGLWGDATVKTESQKSIRHSAEAAEWDVIVPANGKFRGSRRLFGTRF